MRHIKVIFYTIGILTLGIIDGVYFSSSVNEAKISAAQKAVDAWWKSELINREFAQYNSRSGEWEFRSLDDVSTSAMIQGKGIALDDVAFVNYSLDKKRSRK
jgi:hypothetical protein